jgi:hypothetical protein
LGAASREKIKTNLAAHGYPLEKIQANPNYLYTALARLAKGGKIVEVTPGHYKVKLRGR